MRWIVTENMRSVLYILPCTGHCKYLDYSITKTYFEMLDVERKTKSYITYVLLVARFSKQCFPHFLRNFSGITGSSGIQIVRASMCV